MDAREATPSDRAPTGGVAALVLDVRGTRARLWFPDLGESAWVDLAEVGYDGLSRAAEPAGGSD